MEWKIKIFSVMLLDSAIFSISPPLCTSSIMCVAAGLCHFFQKKSNLHLATEMHFLDVLKHGEHFSTYFTASENFKIWGVNFDFLKKMAKSSSHYSHYWYRNWHQVQQQNTENIEFFTPFEICTKIILMKSTIQKSHFCGMWNFDENLKKRKFLQKFEKSKILTKFGKNGHFDENLKKKKFWRKFEKTKIFTKIWKIENFDQICKKRKNTTNSWCAVISFITTKRQYLISHYPYSKCSWKLSIYGNCYHGNWLPWQQLCRIIKWPRR